MIKISDISKQYYSSPENIYEDFLNNKITKRKAINLITSLMEPNNPNFVIYRSLNLLDKLNVKNQEMLKKIRYLLSTNKIKYISIIIL